jgi:hypothetical protein
MRTILQQRCRKVEMPSGVTTTPLQMFFVYVQAIFATVLRSPVSAMFYSLEACAPPPGSRRAPFSLKKVWCLMALLRPRWPKVKPSEVFLQGHGWMTHEIRDTLDGEKIHSARSR